MPSGARAITSSPAAEPVDGLVVEAVDVQPAAAGEPVQRRAGRDVHGVRGLVRLVALTVLELREVGQVLVQRAAADDVHPLHAAADRQHRKVALACGGEQRELVLVGDAVDVGPELADAAPAP